MALQDPTPGSEPFVPHQESLDLIRLMLPDNVGLQDAAVMQDETQGQGEQLQVGGNLSGPLSTRFRLFLQAVDRNFLHLFAFSTCKNQIELKDVSEDVRAMVIDTRSAESVRGYRFCHVIFDVVSRLYALAYQRAYTLLARKVLSLKAIC